MVKIEKIEEEMDEITTFITQTTEALRTIIITLKAMELKLNLLKPITKAFPGIPHNEPLRKIINDAEPSRKVVSYEKKDGTEGFKIVGGDVIFEKQAFKYLQECKYGCGNYISFDNYKKGQKALHITEDFEVIGRYCPKYE